MQNPKMLPPSLSRAAALLFILVAHDLVLVSSGRGEGTSANPEARPIGGGSSRLVAGAGEMGGGGGGDGAGARQGPPRRTLAHAIVAMRKYMDVRNQELGLWKSANRDDWAGDETGLVEIASTSQGSKKYIQSYLGKALMVINGILLVTAVWWVYLNRLARKAPETRRLLPQSETQERHFLGLRSAFQACIFAAYVGFSCLHMFLQHRAGSTGYSPAAATVLVYLGKAVVALGMFLRNSDHDFSALWRPAGGRFGRVPGGLLCLVPGACLALYDTFSFFSLAGLDPISYQIIMHARMVFIALTWQVVFRKKLTFTQWAALILVFIASVSKAVDKLGEVGIPAVGPLRAAFMQCIFAVVANVSSELLLKELSMPTDLINAAQYFQGLTILLAGLTVGQGGVQDLGAELIMPEAWRRLFADPWMWSSILCLIVFGIVTAYFLRELSNVLKEIAGSGVIVLTAFVDWGVLGLSSCTPLGLEAVALAVAALGMYNYKPLDTKRRDSNAREKAKQNQEQLLLEQQLRAGRDPPQDEVKPSQEDGGHHKATLFAAAAAPPDAGAGVPGTPGAPGAGAPDAGAGAPAAGAAGGGGGGGGGGGARAEVEEESF